MLERYLKTTFHNGSNRKKEGKPHQNYSIIT